ncbi:hypothetical protein [Moraxella cuniculi]|uniref:Uncharacterized protein n=1 Tax=Moraxella cuniculi TaxID=34061 RepID=A0A448GY79_9GAMM|nr:hypothetical protein [Moraxella cuniculi]VEG13743.1 Uncharacterised protein [Moraxella cuniculi]
MGKIGNFAYNIGTSLNQEEIGTHRQTITPTEKTLQNLSPEEQLAIKQDNQALLNANEMQRVEGTESGDEVWDQPGVAQGVGKTRQKECRQAGVSSSDCSAYIWARSVSRAKNIASLLVPTSPGEVAFLVATAGGGYVLKVAGKAGVKVIRSFKGKDELNKAVAEAKRIENNVYRDGSQFESNIVNGKPIANLRMEYVNEVQSISSHTQRMLSQGKTEEEVAVWAINKRNELKVKYRGNTPPEKLREIELRNIEKYGNALGPTAHYLRQKGKTWKEIIDSASKADGSDLDFAPKGFNR